MHKKKIDMADSVFIINKDGYIGKDTIQEINYACKQGKPIYYLEPIILVIKKRVKISLTLFQ
ncbi:MAG TPA: hypothetical protein GXZ90_03095 [Clostridiales bacterium]|nr:hypothetical protein [Clostridiales bacterium]